MLIKMNSMLTGKIHTREIDVTEEQLKRWREGELIQDAMPHLSPEDREFLISGETPEEWDAHCSDDGPLSPESGSFETTDLEDFEF